MGVWLYQGMGLMAPGFGEGWHGCVAMSGHGANDAPALDKANIGVWLSHGMGLMMPMLWRRLVCVGGFVRAGG